MSIEQEPRKQSNLVTPNSNEKEKNSFDYFSTSEWPSVTEPNAERKHAVEINTHANWTDTVGTE
jgi:hypothetical protein